MTIACLGQREQLRGRLAGRVVAKEEPGLASQNRIFQCPFCRVVVHGNRARLQKAGERLPAIEHVVDRARQLRLGKLSQPFRLQPLAKVRDDRLRQFKTSCQSHLVTALAISVFNVEQLAEVRQRSACLLCLAEMMARFELTATVHPATRLEDARPKLANSLVGNVRIGGQITLEALQDRLRSNTAAI